MASLSRLFALRRFLLPGIALVASSCAMNDGSQVAGANGPVGLAYAQNPALYIVNRAITPNTVQGTVLGKTYSITPALPTGLSFDTSSGEISGTPTAITPAATYDVTATTGSGVAHIQLQLTVGDTPPTMSYAGLLTQTWTVGSAVSITPTLGGGALTGCVSNPTLPSGVTLSSNCVISGTPVAPSASTNYVVTAENTGGSASLTFNFTVEDVPPAISYGGVTVTAYRGVAMTALTPTSSGGTPVSCTISPALPAGLSISSQCVVTGTPSALAASQVYTVTAKSYDDSTAGTATFTLSVTDQLPALSYPGASSPVTYTAGIAIATLTAKNTGGIITGCSGALPPGLSVDPSTCNITGTPTTLSGATNYTITASNTAGSASATINITVNAQPPVFSYSGTPFTFTRNTSVGTISPASTGGAIVSCSSSPALPAGLNLSSTCVITGTPTTPQAASVYTVTATNTGGASHTAISIAVNEIPPAISYTGSPFTYTTGIPLSLTSPVSTAGAITSCASSPSLPSGINLSSTCVLSGTPAVVTSATSYTITASNSIGSGSTTIQITVNSPPPNISYSGSPYVYSIGSVIPTLTPSNSGGSIVSCSISPAQPTGLTFNTTNCILSGTPTVVTAAANYTITATNTGGSSSAIINIQVKDAPPTITYSPTSYVYTKGTAIATVTPALGGGSVTACSSSPTLPTGLALAATTCKITGTPSIVAAAANYTVTATGSGGSATAVLNLTVNDKIPVISYAGSPYTFTKGTAIATQTPTNTGGTVISCASSPTLPAGLSLSNTCVITGTPTAPSSATVYSISGTNSGGIGSTSITITVKDVAPTLSYAGSPYTYAVGTPVSLTPTTGGGAITSCVSSPSLPAGLSLAATTCAITGTPTAVASSAVYTITASNSGGTATASINITVNNITPLISYAGTPFTFYQNTAIASQTPTNTGGAIVSCSATGVPAGLAIAAADCTLSGTPSATGGPSTVTVSATNSGGTYSTTISITVLSQAPAISFPSSPYTLVNGVAITPISPANVGGAITGCSDSGLPAGLTMDSSCVISGTPTATQATTSYTITATNNGGASSSSATLTIQVIAAPPSISYPAADTNLILTSESPIAAFSPTNSGGTISNCVSSPILPAGLTLDSGTCQVSGTPTAVVPQTVYTVTASNSAGSSSQALTMAVNDVAPNITYAGNLSANTYGFAPNMAIPTETPTNSGGAIVSCASNPGLPSGLALGSDCSITGTPTTTQAGADYTITATNSGGQDSISINITINGIYPQVAKARALAIPASSSFSFVSRTALDGTWNGVGTVLNSLWSATLPQNYAAPELSLVAANDQSMAPITAPGPFAPRISPDRSRAVYASKQPIEGVLPNSYNIWIMNADGSGKRPLTLNKNAALDSQEPVFSSDGTRVYFVSKTSLSGQWNGIPSESCNIWMISVDGSTLVPVTQNTDAGLDSHFAVFPDSN
ncbi:MAG: putative Ig domain-containing protein [Oligoflexia bacterium]|nr:putative Ig domain-containing protein [Oligoflexia bacterium]